MASGLENDDALRRDGHMSRRDPRRARNACQGCRDDLSADPPALAFVFSGEGMQWTGMGQRLLAREPVFHRAMGRFDEVVRKYAGWSPIEEIRRDEIDSRLRSTAIAQPTLCALQLALADLWAAWGVVPAAVTGHGVGEIAAAAVAGVLPPKEALRVAIERGRVMQRAADSGREPLRYELSHALSWLCAATERVLFVSTVTGQAAPGTSLDAEYWGGTVRSRVRFVEAIGARAASGCSAFLEIGPHPALGGFIARTLAARVGGTPLVLPSMRCGDDETSLLASLGTLWQAGHPVDLAATCRGRWNVPLPGYQWERERHLAEAVGRGRPHTAVEFG